MKVIKAKTADECRVILGQMLIAAGNATVLASQEQQLKRDKNTYVAVGTAIIAQGNFILNETRIEHHYETQPTYGGQLLKRLFGRRKSLS